MMKMRNVFAFGLITFFMYACKKSETGCTTDYGNPSATEVTNLRNYIISKGITADESPNGFFYHITFAGTGSVSPTIADSVTIRYKGALSNGVVFDSTDAGTSRKFPLGQLITGWQVGLPLIKKSGVM